MRQIYTVKRTAWALSFLLCVFLIFTACGSESGEPVLPDNSLSNAGVLSAEPSTAPEGTAGPDAGLPDAADQTDPVDLSAAAVVSGADEELMTIEWDYFWAAGPDEEINPAETEIAKALSEEFDAVMDSRKYVGMDFYEQIKSDIQSGDLPDIFIGAEDHQVIVDSGNVREIPWEMIELYAPRYIGMLNKNPDLRNLLKSDERTKYMLWSLEYKMDMLECYSVYRLDWLEALGIEPNGELVELADRLYFTEEAFNSEQFADIIERFTAMDNDSMDTYGMSMTGTSRDWYMSPSLMGMYGLNMDVVNEGGTPKMWFVTDKYREYLSFLLRLKESGAMYIHEYAGSQSGYWEDGWWCEPFLNNTFSEYGLINFKMANVFPDAKILMTPPEVGPGGMQGVSKYQQADDVNINGTVMYVSADVSDQKLARILQIYDTVAFDPEWYMLTNFGVEGTDYTWSGTPYYSGVTVMDGGADCTGLFTNHIMDENAGKALYTFPSLTLYNFAVSDRAKAMSLLPYRTGEGISIGESEADTASALENFPYETLNGTAEEYYRAIMAGEKYWRIPGMCI
jgi:ABC-type glycerol-3-phosphate transport system substrate-binding protein